MQYKRKRPMTVGQLKRILKKYDDKCFVHLADEDYVFDVESALTTDAGLLLTHTNRAEETNS